LEIGMGLMPMRHQTLVGLMRLLPEWIREFERLKKLNAMIMGGTRGKPAPKRKQANVSREGCSLSGRTMLL
jgi:hypothetical protein